MNLHKKGKGKKGFLGDACVFPRKGQTEMSEFMLKGIAIILFTVFLIGGILSISQFKTQVNDNINKRLTIDFGENILAAPCLTEKKGLFLESKLSGEVEYWSAHPGDMDGISCLETSLLTAFRIKTEKNEWFFGAYPLQMALNDRTSTLEFPAAVKLDYNYGDNFENGLDMLGQKNIWDSISGGASVSTDYYKSPSHSLKIDGSKKCLINAIEIGCGASDVFYEKTGAFSVWFYDQNPSKNSEMFASAGKSTNNFLAIGPDNPSDTGGGKYFYRTVKTCATCQDYFETSVGRSAGWHEFKWVFGGSKMQAFIDGTKIYETSSYGTVSILSLKSKKSGGIDGYFDDVKIMSSGNVAPAKLLVTVSTSNDCNNKNSGLNCYNCLEQTKCKSEGCKWEDGTCKY